MTPNDMAKILNEVLGEVLKPVFEDVESIKAVANEAVKKVEGSADITKAELKAFVIERASEERDRLLRDRDSFKGEQGERGFPGKDGKDGRHGKDGLDGKNGKDGKDGIPGEKGERGLPGRDGRDGKDGKDGIDGRDGKDGKDGAPGEKGDRGEKGFISAVEPWRQRDYVAGELATNGGATWQARRNTSDEPNYLSNSWEQLTNGIADVQWEGNKCIHVLANGEKRISGDLKGEKGDSGDTPYITGPYDAERAYAQHEGVQQDGSLWYPAEGKSGHLGKPGKCADWKLAVARGKTGRDGKDADPEVVKELVMRDLAAENAALLEMTIKQMDDFLRKVDFA